eukprot:PhF_6_TR30865/c0_g1_i1/m.45419
MSDLTVPITTVPVASECTMQDLISLMYRLVDTINRQAVAIEVLEGRLSEVSHSVRTLRSYQQAQETTTTTTTTSQGPTSPLHHQQQQQHSAQQYNTQQPIDEDNSIFSPPRQRGGDPLPNAQQQQHHHHHQQSTFQPTPWSPPRGSTMIPHSNNTTTMNPSSATAGMPPPTSPQRFRTYTITSTVAAYPSEPVRQHVGFPAPPMSSNNNNNTGAGWRAPRAASPRKTNFADGCGPSPGVPGLQGGSSSRQGSATRGGVDRSAYLMSPNRYR